LLANLRVNVFIMKLKKEGKNAFEIWNILALWNRSFLVNKNYKIFPENLEKLFIRLVDLDKKMKTWNMLWTEDNDFLVELENMLLTKSCL
jgi:hypothetical protein